VDKELQLHEAMARLLFKAGSNWMPSGNSKLSVALEHYLDGIAHKGEAALIEQALNDGNLTLSDLRVRALKDAAKYTKMGDDLIHRQHQTSRHLQRSIDSIDHKSRLIKCMDLELAAFESKQSVKEVLSLDDKPS
jgi:hypothetical protein